MNLVALCLNEHIVLSASDPHLLGDAFTHPLLLCDGHRDALATFGAASSQNFTSPTSFFARAESMRALSAFVMGLISALHVIVSERVADRDRYSTEAEVSRRRHGSSIAVKIGLQGEIAICYQTVVFSCGQVGIGGWERGLRPCG